MSPDDVQKPEDLSSLDKDGLVAFLKSERDDKVELWNEWRTTGLLGHIAGTPARSIDLSGANLRKAHLPKISLWRARLEGANLIGAHLEGANLYEAHLEGANLYEAHLAGTNLGGARLTEARLSEAHLENAVLVGAHLEGADLTGARLDGAALCQATLRGVNLTWARSLRGVRLYQALLWGMLSLRYDQFLGDNLSAKGPRRFWLRLTNRLYESTIWEESEGHFTEAKDVFKTLKGYFEDAGDYEGTNWAYVREQMMEKLTRVPRELRWLYPRWRGRFEDAHCAPDFLDWLRLEFGEKLANYGDSLLRPIFWLLAVIVLFAAIYWLGGMVTAMPGCSYAELRLHPRPGCAPTYNFFNALLFSMGAMTTTDVGHARPYHSHMGFLMSLEALLGIALIGLIGFVLGNKLRRS